MKYYIIGVLVYVTTWAIYLCYQSDYYKFVFSVLIKMSVVLVLALFGLVAFKMRKDREKELKKNESNIKNY